MNFYLINWDSLSFWTLLMWRNIYRLNPSILKAKAFSSIHSRKDSLLPKESASPSLDFEIPVTEDKAYLSQGKKIFKLYIPLEKVTYRLKLTNLSRFKEIKKFWTVGKGKKAKNEIRWRLVRITFSGLFWLILFYVYIYIYNICTHFSSIFTIINYQPQLALNNIIKSYFNSCNPLFPLIKKTELK